VAVAGQPVLSVDCFSAYRMLRSASKGVFVDATAIAVIFCWYMAKKRSTTAAESVPEHLLAEILERPANEVQLTRLTLDDLRTDVQ
jgi:hypothetical protein